jgi:hypothetical protein
VEGLDEGDVGGVDVRDVVRAFAGRQLEQTEAARGVLDLAGELPVGGGRVDEELARLPDV